MKKSEKKIVPPGTKVMLSGVGTTTGPVRIVRYLRGNMVRVIDDTHHIGLCYDISMSRVIVPGARIRQ